MNTSRSRLFSLAALAFAFVLAPHIAQGRAIVVSCTNGVCDSIQEAVDLAPAGSTILVTAGHYVETHGNAAAVTINKPLKLIAKVKRGDRAVIRPGPGNTEGILIEGTAAARVENVMVKGFTIEGFSENGIWPKYARKFKILNNTVADSQHVGIYPFLSQDGMVKNNVAYGGLDSALWVAGSERIRVIKNIVHSSPTGLQVSVSRKVKFVRNQSYNNVVGLGIYHPNASPADAEEDIPLPHDESGVFSKNHLRDNNLPNPVSSGLVGNLPTGIGALIAGADGAHLTKNIVTGNRYVGIAVVDWCLVTQDYTPDPHDANCQPDDTVLSGNIVRGNGYDPPDHPFSGLASDVIVLGQGKRFCAKNNDVGYAPLLDGTVSDC